MSRASTGRSGRKSAAGRSGRKSAASRSGRKSAAGRSGPEPAAVGSVIAIASERQNGRGETVHVVTSADRADLPGREETTDAVGAERAPHQPYVMVGIGEHRLAPPVAREQQRTLDRRQVEALEQLAQVLVRGSGVAHLEAHG